MQCALTSGDKKSHLPVHYRRHLRLGGGGTHDFNHAAARRVWGRAPSESDALRSHLSLLATTLTITSSEHQFIPHLIACGIDWVEV